MKTIVEALKDLYVALGGKEQDVANLVLNPDVIEKIAAAASDAVKPELPSLTGNAGKFLKVDSDAEGVEWSEAGGGGGGLTLYGPYYAAYSSSKTIEAGQVSDISLSYVTNYDGDTLSAPSGRYNAFFIDVYGLNNGMINLKLLGFHVPFYESQYMNPAAISIGNDGDTDITLYPNSFGVMFYSDVEFTVVS